MGKLRITKAGVGDFEPIFALEQALFLVPYRNKKKYQRAHKKHKKSK